MQGSIGIPEKIPCKSPRFPSQPDKVIKEPRFHEKVIQHRNPAWRTSIFFKIFLSLFADSIRDSNHDQLMINWVAEKEAHNIMKSSENCDAVMLSEAFAIEECDAAMSSGGIATPRCHREFLKLRTMSSGVLGIENRRDAMSSGVLGIENRHAAMSSGAFAIEECDAEVSSGVLGIENRHAVMSSGVLGMGNLSARFSSGVFEIEECNSAVASENGLQVSTAARKLLLQDDCDPRRPDLFGGINIAAIGEIEMSSLRDLLCGVLS